MTNRRSFLGFSATAAATALAAGGAQLRAAGGNELRANPLHDRRQQAYRRKTDAAAFHREAGWSGGALNGDTQAYSNHIANFSKALPHAASGEVDPAAWRKLSLALQTGRAADFAAISLGGTVKLSNPQGAFMFDLTGGDSHQPDLPPPPAFASAQFAGEMTEVYWQALTRDIPFAAYGSDPLAGQAVAELSRLSDFRGPNSGRQLTAGTLFRGMTPGDQRGPFLSQFLALPVPFGAGQMVQQYQVPQPGLDYMTTPAEWLAIQNGSAPARKFAFDPTPRYIRSGRDLAWWVRQDFSYQAYLSAALILNSFGAVALNPGNYYLGNAIEAGFVSFGAPNVMELIAAVATAALRAAWYQKWLLHMRLRPEAFAGCIQQVMANGAGYPVHPDVLNSQAAGMVYNTTGSWLLPMAYPEGSPTHPSYPAGHAAVAGACVTVLKAFFNENFVLPAPVVAAADGSVLQPYSGTLTVGDELNKLAANVALARDTAGVHFRSDGFQGLQLGEAVASGILHDVAMTYNEEFAGFTFTRFDGAARTICPNC